MMNYKPLYNFCHQEVIVRAKQTTAPQSERS